MTIVADRLREAMEDRSVDQTVVAEAIGVTQGAISLILLGKTRRSKFLPDIALYLGVSYDWLIGRDVPKFGTLIAEAELTAEEVRWVDYWRVLTIDERRTMVDLIQLLMANRGQGAPRAKAA
jgi:transcriptional regulator with XRE-family HTH domain